MLDDCYRYFNSCVICYLDAIGTQAHGDQPQEVMARDKRYSHYMGRPFAHFDSHGYTPDMFGKTPKSGMGPFYSPYRRTPPTKLRPVDSTVNKDKKHRKKPSLLTKEERKAGNICLMPTSIHFKPFTYAYYVNISEREHQRKMGGLSASAALLRLSFSGHRENLNDYLYQGGMKEGINPS